MAVLRWDAGALGCTNLVLALRARVEALEPGGRLRVTATDSGAETDVPAWCRMTGHVLVDCRPPVYVIERAAAGPRGTTRPAPG